MAQRAETSPGALYVSPSGDDSWSGQFAEPLRTIGAAQSAIRKLKQKDSLIEEGLTVHLRGGIYSVGQTLELGPEDSGTETSPIVWRAYRDERVAFSGGRVVEQFEVITDESVRRRIDPAVRGKVVMIDLQACGIPEIGQLAQRGEPPIELFCEGKRMPMVCYPKSGWLRISDVPQSGDRMIHGGVEREKRYDGVPVGRHYGRIAYSDDRPSQWADHRRIILQGYWTWDWNDSFQRIDSVDIKKKEITIAEPHHNYGYTKNQRFRFLNVLEELREPGEWFLDEEQKAIYFLPPDLQDGTGSYDDANQAGPLASHGAADARQHQVVVSVLDAPFVSFKDAEYITLKGIDFCYSRSRGVTMQGGRHNLVAGCRFFNIGNDAVTMDIGEHNGVTGCDIHDVALGGIKLRGGDRKTLRPAGNFATNNHIHDFSTWVRTYQWAIRIEGVGNLAAHNLIHDAPHEAMQVSGNEHRIEYNEIHDVMKETGDSGAIHTGRDWTWRGNIIRYNYFHHLTGPGLHGVMGVYLDDWASGFTVYGNIFYRAGRASFIGGGRDNVIENNIYIECKPSVHLDARGLGWGGYYFDGTYNTLTEKLAEMDYRNPPYSERYPELLTLYEDEPAVPKNNRIIRNVSYGGRWLELYDHTAYDLSVVTMKDNVIADPEICRRRQKGLAGWDPYYLDVDMQEGYELYRQGNPEMMKEFATNVYITGDPGFVDIEHGDFRLKDDSPAVKLGFKPIPVDQIGLKKDEHRASAP